MRIGRGEMGQGTKLADYNCANEEHMIANPRWIDGAGGWWMEDGKDGVEFVFVAIRRQYKYNKFSATLLGVEAGEG